MKRWFITFLFLISSLLFASTVKGRPDPPWPYGEPRAR